MLLEGSGGKLPQEMFLDFNSLKFPFLGFRVIHTGYCPDFNLESVFFLFKEYLL